MNTDTPETDLFLDSLKGTFLFNGTMSQYMRKLERERNQARQERDELKAVLESLLELGACVNRDDDIMENKRRRQIARDLLEKLKAKGGSDE